MYSRLEDITTNVAINYADTNQNAMYLPSSHTEEFPYKLL